MVTKSKSSPARTPPIWAQVIIILAILVSGVSIAVLGPYFQQFDGTVDYVEVAVPFFLSLIMLEMIVIRLSNLKCEAGKYELADSWSSVSSGSMQLMVISVFIRPFSIMSAYIGYEAIWNHYAICRIPLDSWWTWLVAFLSIDFCYYWMHRLSHEIEFLWVGHRIHHSSDHYNLSTALRQSYLQSFFFSVVYIPLAFFLPPTYIAFHTSWNTVYQFWVHTCVVKRVPVLEWVMIVPSHHRVHHDRRVHKNFGGTTIIYDRLFGTFFDENECVDIDNGEEICLFGIRQNPKSWTDAIFQFDGVREVMNKITVNKGFWASWICGPGYFTSTMHRNLKNIGVNAAYSHDQASIRVRLRSCFSSPIIAWSYLLINFIVIIILSLVVATPWAPSIQGDMGVVDLYILKLLLMTIVVGSLGIQGMILDRHPFALRFEALRCGVLCLLATVCVLMGSQNTDVSTFVGKIIALYFAAMLFFVTQLSSHLTPTVSIFS